MPGQDQVQITMGGIFALSEATLFTGSIQFIPILKVRALTVLWQFSGGNFFHPRLTRFAG